MLAGTMTNCNPFRASKNWLLAIGNQNKRKEPLLKNQDYQIFCAANKEEGAWGK